MRFLYLANVFFYVLICSDNLKPIAAEERRIEEEEKKAREEQERIAKQLAEGSLIMLTVTSNIQDTVYTCTHLHVAHSLCSTE